MLRKCSICKIDKPEDQFYKTKQKGKYVYAATRCKACWHYKSEKPKKRLIAPSWHDDCHIHYKDFAKLIDKVNYESNK